MNEHSQVPAEELMIGDLIEVPSMQGAWRVRLTEVSPRTSGIKLVGCRTGDHRQTLSFGRPYGELVTRLEPTTDP